MLRRLGHLRLQRAASSVVRVDGVDLHWIEEGSGPPVVLLHGLGDSHQTWSKVVPSLARTRRVLVPDLAGYGLSGRPDADYTLDWHAHLLGAWLGALRLDEVDLVGHSYGGGVAQWMLLQPRHRIRKLGLVAAGGLGREVSRPLRLAALPYVIEYAGQPFMAPGTFFALQTFIRGVYSPRELVRLSIMNGRPGSARALARTVRDVIDLSGQRRGFFGHAHQVHRLPDIGLFWGKDDPVIPITHAYEAARFIRGARVFRFADCGHYPHREHPRAFAAALEEFLGSDDSSTRRADASDSAMLAVGSGPVRLQVRDYGP